MKTKACPWHEICQNSSDGCYTAEPENCVRFMPLNGTNLTRIVGVVETPSEIDYDKFNQYFVNWISAMGWSFCGGCAPCENEEESEN